MTEQIAILGSGMAGLGAAYRFAEEGVAATVYEKESRPGGHTVSHHYDDGFIFDDGPHISFTRNERLQKLFAESVGGEYEVLQTRVNNHWRGRWIKHPAQCNLYPLPPELTDRILREFVEAQQAEPGEVDNYEEWLVASYGRTFAETFPMEYGEKYHTAPAREMSTDWLGPRLYRPRLEEVLHGAVSDQTPDVHYVNHFRYPTRGGFEAYLRIFLERAKIELQHEVVAIDGGAGELRFGDGRVESPAAIVSSLPLPELVRLLTGVPEEVRAAAARLACTRCVIVNVGVDREDLSDHQWTYIYDRDFAITRLSFPHLFSPHTTPPGTGSIQAEIYFSDKYKPFSGTPEEWIEPAIEDLRRCGLVREGDEIVHRSARFIPYANIIFDHDRAAAVALVHAYLEEVGIAPCGRYGEWGYQWTDESFESGEHAAQRVLDGLRWAGRRSG